MCVLCKKRITWKFISSVEAHFWVAISFYKRNYRIWNEFNLRRSKNIKAPLLARPSVERRKSIIIYLMIFIRFQQAGAHATVDILHMQIEVMLVSLTGDQPDPVICFHLCGNLLSHRLMLISHKSDRLSKSTNPIS